MATTLHLDCSDKKKVGTVEIEDLRVIPVVFLPGVMGSNLKAGKKLVWRFDSPASLLGWSLPGSGSVERKKLLHPDKVEVDDQGEIPLSEGTQDSLALQYPESPSDKEAMARYAEAVRQAVDNVQPEARLFGTRKDRGWGEVAKDSYGSFLVALQSALYQDKPTKRGQTLNTRYQKLVDETLGTECGLDSLERKCIDTMAPYHFPVHAVGYNWLGSNKASAERLSERVDKIISDYKKRGMKCHKVILVTHSMGGLVARYYSECLDPPGRDKIYGIVHGVMPSIGAAAAYTRMKRGTENPQTGVDGIVGYITSHILGRNAAEMTAICSQSPGPLELLPSTEYGTDWLKISDRHGNVQSLPGNNPYEDLYLNRKDWWKLIDENLLNPLNTSLNKNQIEADWKVYKNLIIKNVKPLHEQLSGKYHPHTYSFYGKAAGSAIPEAYLTQETALWEGALAGGVPGTYPSMVMLNDGRLDLNEVSFIRTVEDIFSAEEQAWGVTEHHRVVYAWVGQRFTLRSACENGDGTVPVCSGQLSGLPPITAGRACTRTEKLVLPKGLNCWRGYCSAMERNFIHGASGAVNRRWSGLLALVCSTACHSGRKWCATMLCALLVRCC